VGRPRTDLKHHLEELRDAHPGSLEETILTGILSTALDSGASRISVVPDAAHGTLTVADDGRGMKRRDLVRLHNLAASARQRGDAAAAAAAGLRLGLLVAEDVIIETRRGATPLATTWRLATRYRAPWQWIPPPGLTAGSGTVVVLRLANPLSPLLDTGYLDAAIGTHFAPLLDPACDALLRRHGLHEVAITVGGQRLSAARTGVRDRLAIPIRLGRKRLPSAIVVLQQHEHPLPEDQQGIAVSARGRVIHRGWEWLGLAPASAWRVTGFVEAPELADCLTPDGTDFVRTGPQGVTYLAHREAIQAVIAGQLRAWGDAPEEDAPARAVRLERELEQVLEALADEYPRLRLLADDRPVGQTPLPLASAPVEPADSRSARCRLTVQFESHPGVTEVGRLADSTIWINDAHPAFVRAAATRASGYHTALTVALAVAPHAAPGGEPAFITQFLAQWGRTTPRRARRARRTGAGG
jgi:hypothetical protein